MRDETNRRLLHAARALLRLDAATFASRLGVSVTTIRRVEAGANVKAETIESIFRGLAAIGVVVIADTRIDGLDVVAGVGLTGAAEVGDEPFLSKHAKSGSRHKRQRRPEADPVVDDAAVDDDRA